MSEIEVLPELKQIIGAMLFVNKLPLTVAEMRKVFQQVGEIRGGMFKDYAKVTEADLRAALELLNQELERAKIGVRLAEVANGYRLENEAKCGPWLRQLLQKGRPNRLSRPALETLAIIAYRQPCTRAEIEAVRGVAVDQIIRNLMEMQLIRIVGRSELPGRPWLFGTSQKFLEHFGLKRLDDLPGTEELRRLEQEQIRRQPEPAPAAAAEKEKASEEEQKAREEYFAEEDRREREQAEQGEGEVENGTAADAPELDDVGEEPDELQAEDGVTTDESNAETGDADEDDEEECEAADAAGEE